LRASIRLDPQRRLWSVIADVTTGCNLACAMCSNTPHSRRAYARPEVFQRVFSEVVPHAADFALGCRHEPLLHPDLLDWLPEARRTVDLRRLPASLCLLTSGTLLGGELDRRLARSGLHVVLFSIDTTDPAGYAAVRRPATWPDLRARLEAFLPEARRAGLQVAVQALLMRSTLASLPQTVTDLGALGIRRVHVSQLTGAMRGGSGEVVAAGGPDREALRAVLLACRERARAAGVDLELPHGTPPRVEGDLVALRGEGSVWDEHLMKHDRPAVCAAPWYKLRVDHTGNVFPCQYMLRAQLAWGNVATTPFEAIVNGARALHARESLLAGKAPNAACARCLYGPVG